MKKTRNFSEIFLKTEDNTKIAINHYDKGRDFVVIIAHGWYMCKDATIFKAMSEDFFKSHDVCLAGDSIIDSQNNLKKFEEPCD